MNYDPCTCATTSSIFFSAQLVQESTLQFTMGGTVRQDLGSDGGNHQTLVAKKTIDNGKKLIDASVSSYNSYRAGLESVISVLFSKAKREKPSLAPINYVGGNLDYGAFIGSVINQKKWEHREGVLKKLNNLVPGAGLLAGATSFLLGLAQPEAAAKPTPLSFQVELKATGTITTKAPHPKGEFFLPGTYLTSATIRQYDNVMGVFTLLNAPNVSWGYQEYDAFTWANPPSPLFYQMTEDIQYVVNPASHLKPDPELEAALVFEFPRGSKEYLDQEPLMGNLLIRENDTVARTRYMHPELLKSVMVAFHGIDAQRTAQMSGLPKVFVQVIAPMEVDTEKYPQYKPKKMFYTGKYAVKLTNRMFSPYEYPFHEFNPNALSFDWTLYENITIGNNEEEQSYLNGTITKDKRVWGKLSTVPIPVGSAGIQFQPTSGTFPWSPEARLKITASEEIDLFPLPVGPRQEVIIPENVEFHIGVPTIEPFTKKTMPQSLDKVNDICNSFTYKNRGYATKYYWEDWEALPEAKTSLMLHIYPNPSSNIVNFTYHVGEDNPTELVIVNLQGQVVNSIFERNMDKSGTHEIQYNIAHLPKGIYICKLRVGSCIETKKLVVQ